MRVRNENQQKAKALCLSEGARISCDRRILFSFQKNHLKLTFYTARTCLFMYPQHGHGSGGNTDCWVSSTGRGGEKKENGCPPNEKGGGD